MVEGAPILPRYLFWNHLYVLTVAASRAILVYFHATPLACRSTSAPLYRPQGNTAPSKFTTPASPSAFLELPCPAILATSTLR